MIEHECKNKLCLGIDCGERRLDLEIYKQITDPKIYFGEIRVDFEI